MKRIKVKDTLTSGHSLTNDIVSHTASYLSEATINIKLDDELKKRGLNQKELARMTGIRIGTISDFVNGKGTTFNKVQIVAIMVALRITELSDLIEIQLPYDLVEQYDKESDNWKATKEMPNSVHEMYKENVLKEAGL